MYTGDLECRNCGQKQAVAYPIFITMLLSMMKVWEKMHLNCLKPIIESEPNEEKATI